MSFIVEDGTGRPDANSYISVGDADTYNDNHQQDTEWDSATSDEKEAALRQATQHLDISYMWRGIKKTEAQALEFPRSDAYYDDNREIIGVPQRLKNATVEAAIRIVNGVDLMPDLGTDGAIKRRKVKADVVEEDIEYSGVGVSGNRTFQKIDNLVSGLVQNYQEVFRK